MKHSIAFVLLGFYFIGLIVGFLNLGIIWSMVSGGCVGFIIAFFAYKLKWVKENK